MVVKLQFDHEALRKKIKSERKASKLNLKYASEACGIAPDRLGRLERGYSETRDRITKFTAHEILSLCFTYGLDIWAYTILPMLPRGTAAEQRDRAWAEAQQSWQQTAELKQLLKLAIAGKLSRDDRDRVKMYCGPVRMWRLPAESTTIEETGG